MAGRLPRSPLIWTAVGTAGFLALPWYALADGFFTAGWPARMMADRDFAPGAFQAAWFARPWLLVPGLVLLGSLAVQILRPRAWRAVAILGAAGFVYTLGQGFTVGLSQPGMGVGALVVLASFLFQLSAGLAGSGRFRGDPFVAGAVVSVAVLVGLFTFFPVVRMRAAATAASRGTRSCSRSPPRPRPRRSGSPSRWSSRERASRRSASSAC